MAKIGLSNGFTIIPEGEHIFQIVKTEYKEDFGKLMITMQTKDGLKHTERFSFIKADGSTNDGALAAFSFFARTCLGDNSVQEVDPEELVGFFIKCTVEHDVMPNKNDPTKTVTFVRLSDKSTATGFEGDEAVSIPTEKTQTEVAELTLDDILG